MNFLTEVRGELTVQISSWAGHYFWQKSQKSLISYRDRKEESTGLEMESRQNREQFSTGEK